MKSKASPRRDSAKKRHQGLKVHERTPSKDDKRKEINMKRSDNARLENSSPAFSVDETKPGKRKRQPSRKVKGEEEENDRKRRDSKSTFGDRDRAATVANAGKRQASQRHAKKVPNRFDSAIAPDINSEKNSRGGNSGKSSSSKLVKQVGKSKDIKMKVVSEKTGNGSQLKKGTGIRNGENTHTKFDNFELLLKATEIDSNHPSPEKAAPESEQLPKANRADHVTPTSTRRRRKKSSVQMLPASTFWDDGSKKKAADIPFPSPLAAEKKGISGGGERASAITVAPNRSSANGGKAQSSEKKKRLGKPSANVNNSQNKPAIEPSRNIAVTLSKEKVIRTNVKPKVYKHQRRPLVRSSHVKRGEYRILLDGNSDLAFPIPAANQLKLAKFSEPLAKMLLHWLSHKRARLWSRYEWVCGDCDRAELLPSDRFSQLVRRTGIADGVKLTRFEWGIIRQRSGNQQRYLPRFLASEREKLHEERARYRQKHEQVKLRRSSIHQYSSNPSRMEPEGEKWSSCAQEKTVVTANLEAIAMKDRLDVSDRVQAIHPGDRELMLGKILTVGRDNFLVQFDRRDHGAHTVPDIDVCRVASYPCVKDPMFHEIFPRAEIVNSEQLRDSNALMPISDYQTLPSITEEGMHKAIDPQIVHTLTGTNGLLPNGMHGWAGPMSIDANAAIYVTAAEAVAFASKAPPVVDALLELESTLQEKEHLVQNLRELNEDAERRSMSSEDNLPQFSESFLFHYATKLNQLRDINARQDQILHYIRSSSRLSPFGPTKQQQLAAAARFHAQSFASRLPPVQTLSGGGAAADTASIPGGSQQSVNAFESKEILESEGSQPPGQDMNSRDALADEKVVGTPPLQSKSSQGTNYGVSTASIGTPVSQITDKTDDEAYKQSVFVPGQASPMAYFRSSAEEVAKAVYRSMKLQANTLLSKSINITEDQSNDTTDKEERQLLHGLVKSCATTLLLLGPCCGQPDNKMKSACIALAVQASKPSHTSNKEAFSRVSACVEKLSEEI